MEKTHVEEVFKLYETPETAEKHILSTYGEKAQQKIAKIQQSIKRGLSFGESCLIANVDEKGFQKIVEEDKIISFLIDSAQLEYKASIFDDIRQNGNSKDKMAVLEMTAGAVDGSGSPLQQLIQHIQEEGQGKSMITERIQNNPLYGKLT